MRIFNSFGFTQPTSLFIFILCLFFVYLYLEKIAYIYIKNFGFAYFYVALLDCLSLPALKWYKNITLGCRFIGLAYNYCN